VREVVPGIFHWTAFHQRIKLDVSSYYVDPLDGGGATLLDPMLPAEGLDWFRDRGAPERIVLTNRHHYRHSARLVEAFGCPVLCQRSGLHEFEGGTDVTPFDFGDELAAGITALEVGAICSEETALHIRAAEGALAFADGVVRFSGAEVGFVPDYLLGDEPEGVKRGLLAALRRLLEHDFDHLLFAHGEPIVGGGKAALRTFVERTSRRA
jgi:glyoxylase-like metal-dependent hydrolase (beta-lactamase superfamily II)